MSIEIDGVIYYTIQDIQEKLGNAAPTIRGWINTGKLKGRKVGRRFLVASDNLHAFLRETPEGTTNA